jgi:hypothetical protein
MSILFLFLQHAMNLTFSLVCCPSQTVLPKSGPSQHDIHYWLGNDTNKVITSCSLSMDLVKFNIALKICCY